MKAVIVDENYKYHPLAKEFLTQLQADTGVEAINRAHFGYTTDRGQTVLARDLEKGLDCQTALLEFGGNDCDFNWVEVAAAPEEEHMPHNSVSSFIANLKSMVSSLKGIGVQPILMTLPPLDAEKYLNFIGRLGCDTKAILRWLGDVQMIYRWQELYSNAVMQLAAKMALPLVDVRSRLLSRRDYRSLTARDGIHLTADGYQVVFDEFRNTLQQSC